MQCQPKKKIGKGLDDLDNCGQDKKGQQLEGLSWKIPGDWHTASSREVSQNTEIE